MTAPEPFRVQMRLKNNRILRAIEGMGYQNVNQFCVAAEMSPSDVGSYVNLKKSPLRVDYKSYTSCAVTGCEGVLRGMAYLCKKHRDENVPNLLKTWRSTALNLATALAESPDHLWPECLRELEGARLLAIECSQSEVMQLSAGEKLEKAELARDVTNATATCLTEREEALVRMRFGFDGDPMTLAEIGVVLGISANRVRQIEARALLKLRHINSSRRLLEHA